MNELLCVMILSALLYALGTILHRRAARRRRVEERLAAYRAVPVTDAEILSEGFGITMSIPPSRSRAKGKQTPSLLREYLARESEKRDERMLRRALEGTPIPEESSPVLDGPDMLQDLPWVWGALPYPVPEEPTRSELSRLADDGCPNHHE